MNSARISEYQNVWEPPVDPIASDVRPVYVTVMGNTGSGKSTLVGEIAELLREGSTIAIDERSTHHPYLDRLFHESDQFAYELQLNFMVQRVLIVKRWLAAGVNVVMERSHFDDPVFIRHLQAERLASAEDAEAYMNLWSRLAVRAPMPDLMVALHVPAEVSVARITSAENNNERPREFRSESQKRQWIESWWRWYDERLQVLTRDRLISPRLLLLTGVPTLGESVAQVRQRLG